jgi:hypothetical protein
VLAGVRLAGRAEGELLLNGAPREQTAFRTMSCYVMQRDVLLESATVRRGRAVLHTWLLNAHAIATRDALTASDVTERCPTRGAAPTPAPELHQRAGVLHAEWPWRGCCSRCDGAVVGAGAQVWAGLVAACAPPQVREALTTSALLQLPRTMPRAEKDKRVDAVLDMLVRGGALPQPPRLPGAPTPAALRQAVELRRRQLARPAPAPSPRPDPCAPPPRGRTWAAAPTR